MDRKMLKILVTGKNRKVANDICSHLESDRGYIPIKSDPVKSTLFDITLAELPRVIIICLGNENVDSIRVYDVFSNVVKQGNCVVIVVTNDDDEKLFMKYTQLDRVLLLSRPVSLFALFEKLDDIEERFNERKEENLSVFREFENDGSNGSGRKKILVVDDDSEQLVMIREQLEEFYDVTPVKSGDAAFKYLLNHKPDLILLDYLMPEKDGPSVLRQMRTIDEYADIPVIFLTGMTERSAVLHTLAELKPQGYIIKPSRKSEIVAKIIDVLG